MFNMAIFQPHSSMFSPGAPITQADEAQRPIKFGSLYGNRT